MSETARPFYVTTAEGQIRGWRVGAGADLVAICGLTLAAETIALRLARAFHGWRITVLEPPGIGGSSEHDARSLAEMAAALAAAARLAGVDACALICCDLAAALAPHVAAALGAKPEATLSVGAVTARAWARNAIAPPDLTPRSDGTHLVALWSFLRDRHVLAPDDPTQAARDGDPLPSPHELDAALAAFAVRPLRYAELWRTLAAAQPAGHLAREAASFDAAAARLSPGAPAARALAPTTPPMDGRMWADEIETPRGRMHLRRAGGAGPPVLVIPTGGGSSSQFAPVVHGLAEGRQAFSVDFLGNGLSAKPPRERVTIADLADDMAALLETMRLESVDVWGSHTGAVVALELALRHPRLVRRLVMEGPVYVAPDFQADLLANYFPRFEPDTWGRHLQTIWNWRRDMFLFWPWYRVARDAARRLGLPTPQHLHDYAIGILESGATYDGAYRAAFSYDTRSRLPLLTQPALVTAGPNDMLVNALAETRALALPNVEVRETPTTMWWPDPEPAAAAGTLAVYRRFLDA
ncbi:MAG: alpha/beta hydrolase [Rhizobiales bacterium]|nr:alpha/beta hydrolase [Hyphomicrobiales bacterium]